jgi:ADP-ribose pyrophosphatase
MKKVKSPAWKKVRSKVVYENPWMRIRHDGVICPDGKPGEYGVVEKEDFPLIVASLRGRYFLVRQHRYPVNAHSWEFPQGHREPGESVRRAGLRELREETGLTTRLAHIRPIGYFWLAPGHHTQGCHVLLADRCTRGEPEPEEMEFGLEVREFSGKEIEQMIGSGNIKDGPTIAAWYLVGRSKKRRRPSGKTPKR